MPARAVPGRTVAASAGALVAIAALIAGGYAGGYAAGARSEAPAATSDLDVGPISLTDPMTCQIDHQGDPTSPQALTLTCDDEARTLQGPWVDRQMRDFATTNDGWRITQGTIVSGDARLWLRSDDLDCVVTRDLLDSASATDVRCRELEPPAPQPPAQPAEPEPTTVQA